MQVYIKKPMSLIRITIKKLSEETKRITLCETTQKEVYVFIRDLIEKQNISTFAKGNLINIEIREAEGGKNLKSVSLSFKGLDTLSVQGLILNAVTHTV